MSQYAVLNKEQHRQLRIKTGYGAELDDAVMYVMTYALEFRDVQNCYPILFTKDSNTGSFLAAAVLGFEAQQNLFLQGNSWGASYVPVMAQRQPFLIATGGDSNNETPAVSINLDHPRVSQDEGEALFDSDGNTTEFLEQKIALLHRLHQGLQHNNGFIEALLQHQLLEQVTLDLTFNDGEKKSLQGFYSIAEERLYQLKGDILESLSQAGYLQPIFMAVASLSRMRDVIDRRNRLQA